MNCQSFRFLPDYAIRIEDNRKPSGPLRWTALFRFFGNNPVGTGGKPVRYVDEVFEPVIESDGSFRVAQFDDHKFYPVVVDEGAKAMIAVGRYLDSVHGTVVGSFVCPATPSDIAEYASRGSHNHAA